MAAPIYNSTKKRDLAKEIATATIKSNELHSKQMALIDQNADFDEIMEVRTKRNNILIQIETLQSRIDNIGKATGIIEQSTPKFK